MKEGEKHKAIKSEAPIFFTEKILQEAGISIDEISKDR